MLYIKPRNTGPATALPSSCPHGVDELEIGATLGIVIGRTACRVTERDALSFVAGYTVVNDVSVPHASYYRPSLRFKVRDSFCRSARSSSTRAMVPTRTRWTSRVDDRRRVRAPQQHRRTASARSRA